MNKDRIVGTAKTVAGNIKQVVGKAVGDHKTGPEGNAEVAEGTVQNAVGGVKDTIRSITGKS
jgi:uncharacterized protein YjbJ (UPF0337 family)